MHLSLVVAPGRSRYSQLEFPVESSGNDPVATVPRSVVEWIALLQLSLVSVYAENCTKLNYWKHPIEKNLDQSELKRTMVRELALKASA
jgi:hypothetical protein